MGQLRSTTMEVHWGRIDARLLWHMNRRGDDGGWMLPASARVCGRGRQSLQQLAAHQHLVTV